MVIFIYYQQKHARNEVPHSDFRIELNLAELIFFYEERQFVSKTAGERVTILANEKMENTLW